MQISSGPIESGGKRKCFIGDYLDQVREGFVEVNIKNESKSLCHNICE